MLISVNRALRAIFLFAAMAVLSACKTDVILEVFASDFFIDENISTPAQMKIPIPTCGELSDYEDSILAIFTDVSDAKIAGCEEEGYDSVVLVSLFAEIASGNSYYDLALFRSPPIEYDGQSYVSLSLAANSEFITRILALMEDNFLSLSYEDLSLEVELSNDTRGDILAGAAYAWVDGVPYENFSPQVMSHRDKLLVKYPSIFSDLLLREGQPTLIYVSTPK